MARFEDFTPHERRVLREAMAWSQSEFYDPGHTVEERDTLQALIHEAKAANIAQEPPKEYRHIDPAEAAMPDALRANDGFLPSMAELAGEQMRAEAETAAEAEETPPQKPFYIGPSEAEHSASKTTASETSQDRPREYKGFLLIKCAECGDVHAFCAKQPVRTYRCAKCGAWTELKHMAPLRVVCECGHSYGYMTNLDYKQMDVTCFNCGAPVAVEWNERFGRYITIGVKRGRKGGGKK